MQVARLVSRSSKAKLLIQGAAATQRRGEDLRPGDLVNALPIAMAIFRPVPDGASVLCFANPAFESFGGYQRHEALGLTADQINGFDDGICLAQRLTMIFSTGEQQRFDLASANAAVSAYLACTLYPILSPDGQVSHVCATILDVTTEKLAQRQLLHAAYHDELTGLPNRMLFQEKLSDAIDRPDGGHCAVMWLNLDRFQQVNESLGHIAGDELLTSVAARLTNAMGTGATLSRLSGDEFAVLVENVASLDRVHDIANRIHGEMVTPYPVAGFDLHMTMSIGIASTLDASRHPEDLMRDADFAQHRAKALGRARTEVYHSDHHGRARNLFQLEGELRQAIGNGELALHYQPIIDLQSGRLQGFEALARWPHAVRGMVSPAEFVPIAEDTGLIVPLGRWALHAACRELRSWRERYGDAASHLTMAVNVSSIQFSRDSLVDAVTDVLSVHQLPGSALTLELTESAIVENPDHTRSVLQALKALDITIAIDDFGTGYSSLAHLQRFPIDRIKLDRSFVSQMTDSLGNRKLIAALVMLAHSLDKTVVAEGIETEAQRIILEQLGCHFGQGFHLARPLTAEAASDFICKDA